MISGGGGPEDSGTGGGGEGRRLERDAGRDVVFWAISRDFPGVLDLTGMVGLIEDLGRFRRSRSLRRVVCSLRETDLRDNCLDGPKLWRLRARTVLDFAGSGLVFSILGGQLTVAALSAVFGVSLAFPEVV